MGPERYCFFSQIADEKAKFPGETCFFHFFWHFFFANRARTTWEWKVYREQRELDWDRLGPVIHTAFCSKSVKFRQDLTEKCGAKFFSCNNSLASIWSQTRGVKVIFRRLYNYKHTLYILIIHLINLSFINALIASPWPLNAEVFPFLDD